MLRGQLDDLVLTDVAGKSPPSFLPQFSISAVPVTASYTLPPSSLSHPQPPTIQSSRLTVNERFCQMARLLPTLRADVNCPP